ncbi:MAG: excinuclease ABC subunit UvrA [Patescibacteria group bacterium]|nr:excinuclease ABC subunit UvrA [Patescibacteria group bacterium]
MLENNIKIKGARTHNLKDIDLDLPRNQLIVITGLSGSGKSSLAFDTIYAEGQRRYVESLSAYARQFVGLMDKPDFDLIEGLSPAIAIDQRTVGNNPRSTVGTVTEIYDYLRLLYARVAWPYCPHCQTRLKKTGKSSGRKDKKKQEASHYAYACPTCSFTLSELEPRNFSFNSNYGACSHCGGLGTRTEIDPELVFSLKLNLLQGAIKPLAHANLSPNSALFVELRKLGERYGFSLDTPLQDMNAGQRAAILNGDKQWQGLNAELLSRYEETKSNFVKQEIEKCMRLAVCPACSGFRLKPEYLAAKIKNLGIADISDKTIDILRPLLSEWLKAPSWNGSQAVVQPILKEIIKNLEFLERVGLSYLTLSRPANSLSGGEAQRIRLAAQVGSTLSGVLYILDEPSIGLHQRDNDKLIAMLKDLRDNGNTVIVVEHDAAMMQASDYLVDVGPGAGEHGGKILFAGKPEDIKNCRQSLTGAYLSGAKTIAKRESFRPGNGKFLTVVKASEHNLKNIDVQIPLGKFVAITGVSGSGKSTLMSDILANSLNKKFYRAKVDVGAHKEIIGLDNIDKVIDINQSPIGRTPRSNPATYTGLYTYIRDLFAELPEARLKRLSPGHFSFNVAGGRCEACAGDGAIKVEMQFLNDVYLTCEVCHGQRFQQKILDIKYKGKNIHEVLQMTVSEAFEFFKDHSALRQKLGTLEEVGLGYIHLGQSATTFSGGEAQRIKLATELSRRATGRTLYILDEPTTGLHFADIDRLLKVLNMLVDQGNTVLIIEHNLDVIKSVDWVIDLGPEGGSQGGYIVAAGTPADVMKSQESVTGRYLREVCL